MMKKRMLSIALVLTLVVSCTSALAEIMVFPSRLEQVEQEAYLSNTAITEISLPAELQAIGNNAFKGCSNLVKAIIPGSATTIGTDAFASCSPAMLIRCAPGSPALTYAKAKGIDYNANTKYRALVIGQMYWGVYYLEGPYWDAIAMEKMLSQSRFVENPFAVTVKSDLTKSQIRSAISSTFAGATENDVSLFFYSGHGDKGGKLVGYDFGMITPAELRGWLDTIPGRKIVIVDACYSGAVIGKDTQGFAAESN